VATTRAVLGRESIFKFCHSKSRKKFQNLDLGPDSTRKSLHGSRWVYEGGRARPGRARAAAALPPAWAPTNRLGGMSGHGWAPLQAQRPLRRHSIQTATLLCRPLRCAGGNAASVASLTRFLAHRFGAGWPAGGCKRGRGRCPRPRRLGFVGDWALPTTTTIASGGPRSVESHDEAVRNASSWGA